MDTSLTVAEARVLGSLIEKEITTPEYYPLSLNALTNACNQRSSRHPVMDLDEQGVREALYGLDEKGLASVARGTEGRVLKYEHHVGERFNLRRGEVALLCVLLLRGAQTPGELRGRTERLHSFGDLDEVQSTLQRLAERQPALVRVLPREPGTKEARYLELLTMGAGAASGAEAGSGAKAGRTETSTQPPAAASEFSSAARAGSDDAERLLRLEAEVGSLRSRVAELEAKLQALLG